jgi:hypothetical protein
MPRSRRELLYRAVWNTGRIANALAPDGIPPALSRNKPTAANSNSALGTTASHGCRRCSIANNAVPPAANATASEDQYSHHAIEESTSTTAHAKQHAAANGATRSADAVTA